MSENYPLCTRKKITLRIDTGVEKEVDAVCFGDLAVTHPHEHPDYAVFHVPSGSIMAAAGLCFRYEHVAVAAMMDAARLKNRWVFDDVKEMIALRAALVEIGKRHGGYVLDRNSRPLPFRQDLNGYGDDDVS